MHIEIDGFEELEKTLHDMTITKNQERKAMKLALEPLAEEVKKNAPQKTGNLERNIKSTIKSEDFATIGVVRLGAFYSKFLEYGTSQSKKHLGFFARSINRKKSEAIAILTKELLKFK